MVKETKFTAKLRIDTSADKIEKLRGPIPLWEKGICGFCYGSDGCLYSPYKSLGMDGNYKFLKLEKCAASDPASKSGSGLKGVWYKFNSHPDYGTWNDNKGILCLDNITISDLEYYMSHSIYKQDYIEFVPVFKLAYEHLKNLSRKNNDIRNNRIKEGE